MFDALHIALIILLVVIVAAWVKKRTQTNCQLKMDMRRLWNDHATRTRMYVKSALGNQPDKAAAAEYLLSNQQDIAVLVALMSKQDMDYNALADLLKEHILIAAKIIDQLKADPQADVTDLMTDWKRNGDQVATALAVATNNNVDATKEMMKEHLKQTYDNVKLQMAGQWKQEITKYNEIVAHLEHMADALTAGLLKK